jgi:hypothetical protein
MGTNSLGSTLQKLNKWEDDWKLSGSAFTGLFLSGSLLFLGRGPLFLVLKIEHRPSHMLAKGLYSQPLGCGPLVVLTQSKVSLLGPVRESWTLISIS